nr:TatD family hydrolase [Paenibacillus senegalensis]
MNQYIDAHIHLDRYEELDRNRIVKEMADHGVQGLISVSMDLASSMATRSLYLAHPGQVHPAYGYHPEQPPLAAAELEALTAWIRAHHSEMIAVGEVGLPYYSRLEAEADGRAFSYAPYTEMLEKFIQLAVELNKPIILHAVYEDADLACDLLEKHDLQRAHFHWFKGAADTIDRMIHNRYMISITPDVQYEEEIQQLVKQYPLELMMVETDGPWPFEGPFAGQMTHPHMLSEAVAKIAELKGISSEEAAQRLLYNTKSFYGV